MNFRERRETWAISRDIYPHLVGNIMDVRQTVGDRRDGGEEVLLHRLKVFLNLVS